MLISFGGGRSAHRSRRRHGVNVRSSRSRNRSTVSAKAATSSRAGQHLRPTGRSTGQAGDDVRAETLVADQRAERRRRHDLHPRHPHTRHHQRDGRRQFDLAQHLGARHPDAGRGLDDVLLRLHDPRVRVREHRRDAERDERHTGRPEAEAEPVPDAEREDEGDDRERRDRPAEIHHRHRQCRCEPLVGEPHRGRDGGGRGDHHGDERDPDVRPPPRQDPVLARPVRPGGEELDRAADDVHVSAPPRSEETLRRSRDHRRRAAPDRSTGWRRSRSGSGSCGGARR